MGEDPSAGDQEPRFKGVHPRLFWANVTRKVGLPTLRIHDLRHVFATLVLEGAPLDSIAALLGHSDTVMTRLYANRSQESLKRITLMAGEQLAPRPLAVVAKRPQRLPKRALVTSQHLRRI
jgi:integrase